VHSQIASIELGHEDKGLGSFFAEYIDNTTGSTLLTCLIMVTLAFFYLSQIFIINKMTKMIDFVDV